MRVSVILKNTVPEGMEKVQKSINEKTKQIVNRATFSIRNKAVDSIIIESKTGKTYTRGSITHQASAE